MPADFLNCCLGPLLYLLLEGLILRNLPFLRDLGRNPVRGGGVALPLGLLGLPELLEARLELHSQDHDEPAGVDPDEEHGDRGDCPVNLLVGGEHQVVGEAHLDDFKKDCGEQAADEAEDNPDLAPRHREEEEREPDEGEDERQELKHQLLDAAQHAEVVDEVEREDVGGHREAAADEDGAQGDGGPVDHERGHYGPLHLALPDLVD